MRIAVDNQVGYDAIFYLESKGHEVVLKAGNEPDNIWFIDALDAGAELFISPDWDIAFLCNKHDVKFIQLCQNVRGEKIGKFVINKINQRSFD